MHQMQDELKNNIDHYSQDLIVSHIELLLQYANRFYNRQFITRKATNNDVLLKFETVLNEYFEMQKPIEDGIPSVQYLADCLHMSPGYLSDLLRSLTGQSAQQHIHNKLIENAKVLLSASSLSVAEIAYELGFEYSQSFNRLFKRKTDLTPLEFRTSFN
ncbi:helix-turn-helix domain-containing protein [Autumnicola musiva]|uniref:Helix-turn-helix transcriptional regulator n=1 Tax=Autumnicola musiva TaxID=3075589 RepID=A0ABU3DAF6_9FLAO|nr:helix-turn-helix transcriptional regulator [Zunongwangia sp. F117]MDT0677943.1 helix-turn-helix transcriptional regulator [Zunongwangia sp. F117]